MLKTREFLSFFMLATCLLFFSGMSLIQADEVQVRWSDLVPEVEPYENPFAELSSDQIGDLRIVLLGESVGDKASETVSRKFDDARGRLEAAGLDIDFLAKQRQVVMERRAKEATSINLELIGKNVRLPGYLLPLRVADRRVTEFLLVPTVGACIHTPPPPPNQLIHVFFPKGFEAEGLYTPIWVSGRLEAGRSRQTVRYVDGATAVDVAYKLEAAEIERY